MTKIEFPIENSYQRQDVFGDIQNDDLDTHVFLLKMPESDLMDLSRPLI